MRPVSGSAAPRARPPSRRSRPAPAGRAAGIPPDTGPNTPWPRASWTVLSTSRKYENTTTFSPLASASATSSRSRLSFADVSGRAYAARRIRMKWPEPTASRYASRSAGRTPPTRLPAPARGVRRARRPGSGADRRGRRPCGRRARPATPCVAVTSGASSGRSWRTRLRNSSTRFSIGVPVRNSTRSVCPVQPLTARERRVPGFFTKWASSTTTMPGLTPQPVASGSVASASKVVRATPPRSRHSPNASCRSGPCTVTARNVERAVTSRRQLIRTLAGHTTRKCVSPPAERCASAAMACTVLPSPISSPRITRFWASAKRAPKDW